MIASPPTRVDLSELKKSIEDFVKQAPKKKVSSGVGSEGPAAAYVLVWEYGNLRQKKKGPKTVWGKGGFGNPAWMSSQAPTGYVRVNEPEYWKVIHREMDRVDTTKEVQPQLEQAARTVADACAQIIRDNVPVDTGQLRDSIQAWYPGDPRLEDVHDTTLILEEP